MAKEKTVLKFVAQAMAEANKSDKEKLSEQITEFVENSIIDCEAVISTIKVRDIPEIKLKIKGAKNTLSKAKKEFEKARFQASNNFQNYLYNRNERKAALKSSENVITSYEKELERLEIQLGEYKKILADLTSKQ